jgi:hypothetical protein
MPAVPRPPPYPNIACRTVPSSPSFKSVRPSLFGLDRVMLVLRVVSRGIANLYRCFTNHLTSDSYRRCRCCFDHIPSSNIVKNLSLITDCRIAHNRPEIALTHAMFEEKPHASFPHFPHQETSLSFPSADTLPGRGLRWRRNVLPADCTLEYAKL